MPHLFPQTDAHSRPHSRRIGEVESIKTNPVPLPHWNVRKWNFMEDIHKTCFPWFCPALYIDLGSPCNRISRSHFYCSRLLPKLSTRVFMSQSTFSPFSAFCQPDCYGIIFVIDQYILRHAAELPCAFIILKTNMHGNDCQTLSSPKTT